MTDGRAVLIADDHAPTRRLIRQSVEMRGFTVEVEVADADSAIRRCGEHDVDVALLDIRMPGGGIRAATEIGSAHPDVAVVMLTVSDDDDDFYAALTAGASGYLLKGRDPAEIPDALCRILSGEAAIDGVLMRRLLGKFRSLDATQRVRRLLPGGMQLTSKEWEVLGLLNEGLSTGEIARRLFVADVTVRTHVAAIVRKLGVSDRSEVVRLLQDTIAAVPGTVDAPRGPHPADDRPRAPAPQRRGHR